VGFAVLVVAALLLGPARAQAPATRPGTLTEVLAEHERIKKQAPARPAAEAITAYEDLLDAVRALARPSPEAEGQILSDLAEQYARNGNSGRAIMLHRQAVRVLREALQPEHPRVVFAESMLGFTAAADWQMEEAAESFWRAMAGADRLQNPRLSSLRWIMRGSLAEILLYQEQVHEAIGLFEQVLAHADELGAMDRVLLCGYRASLGHALIKQRLYPEAETALRAARSCATALSDKDEFHAAQRDILLALALIRQGRADEAMAEARAAVEKVAESPAIRRSSHSTEVVLRHAARVALEAEAWPTAFQWLFDRSPVVERLGRDRLEYAELLVDSAEYWFGVDDVSQSTPYARWALDSLKARASQVAAGARRTDEGERRRIRAVASRMVEVMAATPSSRKDRDHLWTNELLQIAQVAHATAAGQAIAQMAGRLSAGNDALALLLAERRDTALAWSRTDLALSAAVQQGVTGAGIDEIRLLRDKAAEFLTGIDRRLAREFPAASRHAGFSILTAAEIQKLLRPDEAILFYMIGEKRSAVWTIVPEHVRMTSLGIGAAELEGMVEELREGLDPARVRGVNDLPAFDVELARLLYQRLVRPIGYSLSHAAPNAKHLMIVADGPLHALPFQVLIAGKHTDHPDPARLAEAHWFVRDYALSTLPSIAALAALRAEAGASRATQPFLGVGDPLLGDRPAEVRGGDLMLAEDDAAWLRGARGVGSEGGLDRLYRGGRADIDALRRLPSLPDTAGELTALARSLKAPAESLRLRETARETSLRQRGALKDYRILAFATHGVTAGEIRGAAEPGLVLTPPEQASEADDGLLTAGEIAGLDLDADWVVLSACNTAAGDGQPGAQGLSGLARAFFLAGSRSLLVSHWPVFSKPAVRLTTGMMAKLDAEPGLARAEAQRQVMLEMIADAERPFLAHPVFWAPFSVVGEGGSLSRR